MRKKKHLSPHFYKHEAGFLPRMVLVIFIFFFFHIREITYLLFGTYSIKVVAILTLC